MNASLSLPDGEDIDTSMRLVARNIAMDIYSLDKILKHCNVQPYKFQQWKDHPRFLAYLKQETEAWNSAHNVSERTKLKAGIIMEEWLPEAYAEMKNNKQGLNHRVELAKLMTKLAGMDNAGGAVGGGGGGGGGFSLQINIAPNKNVTISARRQDDIEDAEVVEEQPMRTGPRVLRTAIPETPASMPELDFDMEDDSALFSSPDTLEGL